MRAIRGARIAMVFQEPMTALNPVFTVGDQIAEVVRDPQRRVEAGRRGSAPSRCWRSSAFRRPSSARSEYPHQLSGGMRQRVVIAMALVMNPALVIADEPTTALDVTIQAQILELLRDLQTKFGTSILLITHDLGVVAETVSRVIVMYGGEIVEEAPVERPVRARASSVHRRTAQRDAAGRPGARASRDDSRHRAAADELAEGLSLSRSLPVRVGALRSPSILRSIRSGKAIRRAVISPSSRSVARIRTSRSWCTTLERMTATA